LWTDAFGVCNYITLYYETGETNYLDRADALITDVHDTLGKERSGKSRLGNSTDENPLLGGLRIGKVDPEGSRDGDGQYFHYVTKWMFALNRMSIAKGDRKYNSLAVQLAESTYPHFVYNRNTNHPRMFWKISIDMKNPAVPSEGNLDPYDGLVTFKILQETSGKADTLQQEIAELQRMVNNKFQHYDSDDPLDLGESLWISHWFPSEKWSETLASKSSSSLEDLWNQGYFDAPLRYRLGFREFGTTLGTQVHPAVRDRWKDRVSKLNQFWASSLYSRDKDITPVMYCASLIPGVWMKDYAKMKK